MSASQRQAYVAVPVSSSGSGDKSNVNSNSGSAAQKRLRFASADPFFASRMWQMLQAPEFVKFGIEAYGAFVLVLFVGIIEDVYKSDVLTSSAYAMSIALLMLQYSAQHFNAWFTIYAFGMDLVQMPRRPSMREIALGVLNVLAVVAMQIAGSVLAAWLLTHMHNSTQRVGATIPADHMSPGDTILWEFVGSVLHFMAVMCTMTRPFSSDKDPEAKNTHLVHLELSGVPYAAGMSMFIASLATIARTGASVNFIRSIGPAIISNQWHHFEYLVVGQALGYLAAGVVFGVRFSQRLNSDDKTL
jgi:glycerol uptake facilitator-like aquaporin